MATPLLQPSRDLEDSMETALPQRHAKRVEDSVEMRKQEWLRQTLEEPNSVPSPEVHSSVSAHPRRSFVAPPSKHERKRRRAQGRDIFEAFDGEMGQLDVHIERNAVDRARDEAEFAPVHQVPPPERPEPLLRGLTRVSHGRPAPKGAHDHIFKASPSPPRRELAEHARPPFLPWGAGNIPPPVLRSRSPVRNPSPSPSPSCGSSSSSRGRFRRGRGRRFLCLRSRSPSSSSSSSSLSSSAAISVVSCLCPERPRVGVVCRPVSPVRLSSVSPVRRVLRPSVRLSAASAVNYRADLFMFAIQSGVVEELD